MSDSTTSELFSNPIPPPPAATPADRAELLQRLQIRRQALVDALAVRLDLEGPLMPSAVAPLAAVQTAIEAVEAELIGDKP